MCGLPEKKLAYPQMKNPLLQLKSTNSERLAHVTKVRRKPKVFSLSPWDWLKHLESDYFPDGAKKSEAQKESDKKKLSLFWSYAKQRGALMQLMKKNLTNREMGIIMSASGFPMGRESVRQTLDSWGFLEQKRKDVEERAKNAVRFLQERPNEFNRSAQSLFGISEVRLAKAIKEAGLIRKPLLVPDEELNRRAQFLDNAGISYSGRIDIKLEDLKLRALHIYKKYGFVVPHEQFLRFSPDVFDAHVRNLDALNIDWRIPKNMRLVLNSPEYILSQLKLLESIGANSELHFLLIKRLTNKLDIYSLPKYESIRKAVIERDYSVLFGFFKGVVVNKVRTRNKKVFVNNFSELAKDAVIEIMSNCSKPESNPALFLSLVSADLEYKMKQESLTFFKENDFDDSRNYS